MSSFPLHTLEMAPAESRAPLATVATRFGFLPNVYAHLAEAPVALEALLQLSAICSRTSLTEPQRHLLLLTSRVENQCSFCVAAHTRGAKAGGVGMDAPGDRVGRCFIPGGDAPLSSLGSADRPAHVRIAAPVTSVPATMAAVQS